MTTLMEPVAPLQEQAEKEAFPCQHCDDWVVENVYSGVWQHDNGHWRCTEADTLAAPECIEQDAPLAQKVADAP